MSGDLLTDAQLAGLSDSVRRYPTAMILRLAVEQLQAHIAAQDRRIAALQVARALPCPECRGPR